VFVGALAGGLMAVLDRASGVPDRMYRALNFMEGRDGVGGYQRRVLTNPPFRPPIVAPDREFQVEPSDWGVIMQTAVRPWLMSGIALIGASVIVVTPVAPPPQALGSASDWQDPPQGWANR